MTASALLIPGSHGRWWARLQGLWASRPKASRTRPTPSPNIQAQPPIAEPLEPATAIDPLDSLRSAWPLQMADPGVFHLANRWTV